MNRVVVRFQDGSTRTGYTSEFLPAKDSFHLTPLSASADPKPESVRVADLKALFFVKDFRGNPAHREQPLQPGQSVQGRKIEVTFQDGEVLTGTTQGYQAGRPGFFIVPADADSDDERCFVVAAATQDVQLV